MSLAQVARSQEWSAGRGACLAFSIALALTALMAAPVVRAPSERIFGSGEILSPEEPNRDALLVIDQFRTGRVPAPYLQPLTDLSGQALARLIGPVASYNVVVLISFPLAALTAYLLARYLLDSHIAALVASFAYAFLPFHVLQAGGHPHIAQTQWLPLYLLALCRCVDRPGPGRALLLLLAASAAVLADFYGGFTIAVLSPVALLAYGAASPRQAEGRGHRMRVTALVLFAAAVVGLGVIGYLVPTIASRSATTAFARSELFAWSARWWSYLVPPADHPLWGSMVSEFWSRHGVGMGLLEHQQVSLSLALVSLALLPLWTWLRGDREALSTRAAPALAVIGAMALLCSLSPERTIGSFTFVRPSALLYEVAPMFRAYARFGVVVGLMTSLLAGAGLDTVMRSPRWGRASATAILGLVVLEYAPFPPWRSRDVLPTAAHRWISTQPDARRVLDCIGPLQTSDTLAAGLVGHGLSFLGGPGVDDCGEPRLGEKLAALGYTDVIVRRNTRVGAWLAEDLPRFADHSQLKPSVEFNDSVVLAVAPERPGATFTRWIAFYPREYEGERTWRWMKEAGTLHLAALHALPRAVLDLDLRSFPGTRRVDWFVNGERRGELGLAPEWRTYSFPLGPVSAGGDIALTFLCRESAVRADEQLHNHDLRPLALAVGTWRLSSAPD